MKNHFFAMTSRMKYINRWGLMNSSKSENISEHSLEVSMLSHALVLISNKKFGTNLDADKAAVLGLYHDVSEILTGDMPTPIKYYNPEIKVAYKKVEKVAQNKLLSLLPDYLQDEYSDILLDDNMEKDLIPFVKAADKLSALIKCIEELKMGNKEFEKAKITIEQQLIDMKMPSVDVFMNEFLPSYSLTIDEQD
ncbi:MAG: 5'-deoxynucleotidase [Oscillospiraceae bacterium]|nr:5'-deoxynucleotidase [Candidatus Ruminococcus equi]